MEADDAEFLTAFEKGVLPRPEWTHRAHLRMAYLYLRPCPDADTILPTIRGRIRAYNAAQGNPDGYHETITAAFARLVAERLRTTQTATFAEFERLHPDLFAPGGVILLRYYEEATLSSPQARANFVPPDREPLPGSRARGEARA
jgi:hypothetical protein